MALRLTFKKDYGSGQNKVLKGQSIIVDAYGVAAINYDKIKEAVKDQLGVNVGSVSSDYYTVEKL